MRTVYFTSQEIIICFVFLILLLIFFFLVSNLLRMFAHVIFMFTASILAHTLKFAFYPVLLIQLLLLLILCERCGIV